MGFAIGKTTYLRDGWNVIDFIVVATGLFELIPGMPQVRGLRTIRMIRPLRSISIFPSMKRLVNSMLAALPGLLNVLFFFAFMFALFGIWGIHELNGKQYQLCRLTPEPDPVTGKWEVDVLAKRTCSLYDSTSTCKEGTYCSNPIEYNYFDEPEDLYQLKFLQYGLVNFDNIGMAILSIFQVITLESWTTMMYMYQDANNLHFLPPIIFIGLCIFGSFFLLNLFLAVIMESFTQLDKQDEDDAKEREMQIAEQKLIDEEDDEGPNEIDEMIENIRNDNKKQEKPDADLESSRGHLLAQQTEVIPNSIQQISLNIQKEPPSLKKRCMQFRVGILYKIASSRGFVLTINILIILNVIVMSLDRHPMPSIQLEIIEMINMFLYFSFLIEMLIKVPGLGLKTYLRDKFNIFDAFIVALSSIEIIISSTNQTTQTGAISVFRGMRILRLFKLAKRMKKLQQLLITIAITLKDIRNFSFLLLLLVFTYSLLGMEMFAGRVKYNLYDSVQKDIEGLDNLELQSQGIFSPRSNFDTFGQSITTIFIILTGEDWNWIMFDHIRASHMVSFLFFVSLLIVGQYILMNLFLAILLQNFELIDMRIRRKEDKKYREQQNKKNEREDIETISEKILSNENEESEKQVKRDQEELEMLNFKHKGFIDAIGKIKKEEDENQLHGRTLFIFSTKNCLRVVVSRIVKHRRFDQVITALIVVASIMLAIESPLINPESELAQNLQIVDYILTVSFTLEVVLKVIDQGFLFNGKESYLRIGWNILDLFVVGSSIVGIIVKDFDISFIKILRLLRVLRPLRVINRNEGLKVAVHTLFVSVPQVINVILISMIIFLHFSIFVVSYFKGQMQYCQLHYEQKKEVILQVVTKFDCLDQGGTWTNADNNFDNVPQGILTLFEMAANAGWVTIMYQTIDSQGIDLQPQRNENSFWGFFFIFFMILGSFFLLNLLVGVVINTFNRERDRIGKNFLLTPAQMEWINIKVKCLRSKPIIKQYHRHGEHSIRFWAYRVCSDPKFDYAILIMLMINTIFLALRWYGQSQGVFQLVEVANIIFTVVFILEATIKLLGQGCKGYFAEGWNRFDFVVLNLAIVGIILAYAGIGTPLGQETTVIRSVRLLRVIRLVKRAESLKVIFDTFVVSLPSLGNVGSLLLLFLYIYSVLGMFLFAEIKFQRDGFGGINSQVNFQTFFSSFLALFRVSTGENWSMIMYDASRSRNILFQCEEDSAFTYQEYTNRGHQTWMCGSPTSAQLFFISFVVVLTLVFLNLFIAIILQNFAEMNNKEGAVLSQDQVDKFREVWAKYDPEGQSYIKMEDITEFLFDIGEPLGFDRKYYTDNNIQYQQMMLETSREIATWQLPTYDNFKYVSYWDVMRILSKRFLIIKSDYTIHDLRVQKVLKKEVSVMKSVSQLENHTVGRFIVNRDKYFTTEHIYFGRLILYSMRTFKGKSEENKKEALTRALTIKKNSTFVEMKLRARKKMFRNGKISGSGSKFGGSSASVGRFMTKSNSRNEEHINQIHPDPGNTTIYSKFGTQLLAPGSTINEYKTQQIQENQEQEEKKISIQQFTDSMRTDEDIDPENEDDIIYIGKSQPNAQNQVQVQDLNPSEEEKDNESLIRHTSNMKKGEWNDIMNELNMDEEQKVTQLIEKDSENLSLHDPNHFASLKSLDSDKQLAGAIERETPPAVENQDSIDKKKQGDHNKITIPEATSFQHQNSVISDLDKAEQELLQISNSKQSKSSFMSKISKKSIEQKEESKIPDVLDGLLE